MFPSVLICETAPLSYFESVMSKELLCTHDPKVRLLNLSKT